MEVVVTEEKKKIFRARKTMKISDRLQLESLHSTLLNPAAGPTLSNPSPPPLVNGTHNEDGQKVSDGERNSSPDPNSPQVTSPATPRSLSSPAPFLSLNLSPSPGSSQSPNPQEEVAISQSSPPPSDPSDFKRTEKEEKTGSSPSPQNESAAPVSARCKEQQKEDADVIPVDEIEEKTAAPEESIADSEKDCDKLSPGMSTMSECIEPMEEENNSTNIDSGESTSIAKHEKPSPTGEAPSDSTFPAASGDDKRPKAEVKEEGDHKASVRKGSNQEKKMDFDLVEKELKLDKSDAGYGEGPTRPSSTPPCNTDQGRKSSNSGLKRTLSEGHENDPVTVKREGKRPKVEHEELEAHLELKITAKAGSQQKLEKIVQQLVNERLQILELKIFDKHFRELKDRVDKIECATKHQTAINSLQSKIARLAKKFGEANQMSENKRKQEAIATAAGAAAAAAAAAVAAKPATVTNNSQAQRAVRTSVEVKQTPATVASSSTTVVPVAASLPASTASPASTSTPTIVQQGSILQLITSSSNAASTLATGITTQSQTGTLVLKTTSGSGMVAAGQPLVIQLPLSMNGQTGTLVNFPVSSLATSLNKSKTTPSTTTFILKPSPAVNTASAPTSTAAAFPTLQASPGQVATTQISLARAVYQGGAGRITTPNAGVSVTTVRAPTQSVSVAGAVSSTSSPAASGPAATGSTAPGTPQGTSLTSKTDNQASPSTPSKGAAPPPPARPKGSVIDLTEDDDDVQVTGVKNAQSATPSTAPRSNPVISIPSSKSTKYIHPFTVWLGHDWEQEPIASSSG